MTYYEEEEDLFTLEPDRRERLKNPNLSSEEYYQEVMKLGIYKDVTLESFTSDRRKQLKNKKVKRMFFVISMYSMYFSLVEM